MPRPFPSPLNAASIISSQGLIIDGSSKLGQSVASAGDVNNDGIADIIVGTGGGNTAGAAYVIYGRAGELLSPIAVASITSAQGFIINYPAGWSWLSWSVASAGDVNNDGVADIIVGVSSVNSYTGAAYVIYGGLNISSPITVTSITSSQGFIVNGQAGSQLGCSVAGAGDINNDGIADIIVGALGASSAAYVIYGGVGLPLQINASSITSAQGLVINGPGGAFGSSVASAGDVNNDGIDDVIIGAQNANSNAGAAYVIYGGSGLSSPMNASSIISSQGFIINGPVNSALGQSVASAGDINNDGVADVVVGAPSAVGSAGAAYIIYGGTGIISPITALAISNTQGLVINGPAGLGYSVASAGDINNDGVADVVVGAPYTNTQAGTAYIIYGKSGILSSMTAAAVTSSQGFIINGMSAIGSVSQVGQSVASAGDFNHDGIQDLIIGANHVNGGAGAVYVIYGFDITRTPTPTPTATPIPTKTPTSTITLSRELTPLPPEKPWHEKLVLAAKVVGPIMSAISGAAGIYFKRGLIKSVIFKNQYTKSEEIVGYDQVSNYEHMPKNRKGAEIPANEVHIVRALRHVKDHVPLECMLPKYFAGMMKHKPLASGTALPKWLEYSIDINRLTIIKDAIGNIDVNHPLIVQIIAHDGEILEEFPLRIIKEGTFFSDKSQDVELQNIDITSSKPAESSPSKVLEVRDGLEASSTPYVRVNYAITFQYANPLLNDPKLPHLLTLAQATHGAEGASQLIDLGENTRQYLKLQHLREAYGDAEAVKLILGREDSIPHAVASDISVIPDISSVFLIAKELIEHKSLIGYIMPEFSNAFSICTTQWIGLHLATTVTLAYFLPAAPIAKIGFVVASTGTFALREIIRDDINSIDHNEPIDSFTSFATTCWKPTLIPSLASFAADLSMKSLISLSPAMICTNTLMSAGIGAINCYANNAAYHRPKMHQSLIEQAAPYVADGVAVALGALSMWRADYATGAQYIKHGFVVLNAVILTDHVAKTVMSLVLDEMSMELAEFANGLLGIVSAEGEL